MNPRLTGKDRSLIKGAVRRAFSRSALHKRAEDAYRIEHYDPSHPRCKKWSWCASCGEVVPTWTCAVDHREPVIPVDRTFEEMTLDETVDRTWCHIDNLQNLCDHCHSTKTLSETKERKRFKDVRKEREANS